MAHKKTHLTEECPGGCEHTDSEHIAFDRGVLAGRAGLSEDDSPYFAGHLLEAWLTGHSVGLLDYESEQKKK